MRRKRLWEEFIIRVRDRMGESSLWFPYPAFLSFFLALLLIGHLLVGLNPRLGHHADVMSFELPKNEGSSIWLALASNKGKLYITTFDRKVFLLERDQEEFIAYLKEKVKERVLYSALQKNVSILDGNVVLAVDQSLVYRDLRRVIEALGKANISRYSFEVRVNS